MVHGDCNAHRSELTAGLLSGRIDFIVGALRNAPGEAFSTRALFEDKAALVARAGGAGRPCASG
jgi:DNA-binding transcriptional LysR family regulator